MHIVLVDDGSTDNTPALCNEYEQRYPCIHTIHQKNGGVSRARNVGLDYILNICTHGYIIFLDADDKWFPLSGETVKRIVDNTADIVGFSTYYSNEEGNRFKLCHRYTEQCLQDARGGITDWIWGGTLNAHFLKLEFIKANKIRFMEDVKCNEDIIFMRQAVFCATSFSFNDEKLYIYRNNSSSVTSTAKGRRAVAKYWEVIEAWRKAATWQEERYCLEHVNDGLEESWKELCRLEVGGYLLEAARLAAENGESTKQIIKKYQAGEYSCYLQNLKYDSLAAWQKKITGYFFVI